MSRLEFTPAQNKIRKLWLFWLIIVPAVLHACRLLVEIISPDILSKFGIISFGFSSNLEDIIKFILGSLLILGFLYLNYYCAYKNPGTRLLLFHMTFVSFSYLIQFIEYVIIFKKKSLLIEELVIQEQVIVSAKILIGVFSFYYSYKLWEINKKIQNNRLMASLAYKN